MFSADPAVRKDLARRLPELRSIDAAPWLIQLSRDADPEVRLTAITLMATSGDPLLLEQVERIAGEDPDPRIRDQVTRIGQQRNDASAARHGPSHAPGVSLAMYPAHAVCRLHRTRRVRRTITATAQGALAWPSQRFGKQSPAPFCCSCRG